jgi:ubiquitin-conjugating enzyme (huntingtin interacting protein 2)
MSNESRLLKEIAELRAVGNAGDDKGGGVEAAVKFPSNIRSLTGKIKGAEGTPYENGIFVIDIDIPNGYPFEPPKMKFKTKIWHVRDV